MPHQLVKRVKKISKLPVAVGFGISSAEDFSRGRRYADAVVIRQCDCAVDEENGTTPEKAAEAVSQWIRSVTKASAKARV